MRLINTNTSELHEFFDTALPTYAILSHTWGPEEVTFQDWLYAQKQNPPRWGWVYIEDEVDKVKAKLGYVKVINACRQALLDHFSWLWVDTVCIDKTNSAELSEAINSMYSWYQKAEMCYVFLADVPPSSPKECAYPESAFRRSRWFTRGWTLQELIAPNRVAFFSKSWTPICEKRGIVQTIQDVTKIPDEIITTSQHLTCGHASIAEIMSWASTRTTTRTEDMAYCLMGLLDVKMPLLYGEGRNAFLRLQLETLQKTSDLTFLAWQQVLSQPRLVSVMDPYMLRFDHLETFASEPSNFRFSRFIHDPCDEPPTARGSWGVRHWRTESPRILRISNLGLSLSLPLVETLHPWFQYAVLPFAQNGRALWIPLIISGDLHTRGHFPSATLSVSNSGYTAKESEITLPIHYGASMHHGRLVMSYPTPRLGYGRSFPIDILLTFPAGLQSYRYLRQFPPVKDPAMKGFLLCLFVDDDLPTVAYGAVEFEKYSQPDPSKPAGEISRLAVFFAVDLGDVDRPGPRRWTCRDISWCQFQKRSKYQTCDTYSLELRARSQLICLTDSSFDDMVVATWETQFLLRSESAQADHGIILVDEAARDFSNAESFLQRGGNDGDGSDMTSTRNRRPKDAVIVAQIIFPVQRYKERPPRRLVAPSSPRR